VSESHVPEMKVPDGRVLDITTDGRLKVQTPYVKVTR
jgi:hypothetical protein